MKKFLTAVFLLGLALATVSAWALPLNDFNELLNPGFATGTLSDWQAGTDIEVSIDGPGHDFAATCKKSGGDLWLRQIVDDSRSPGWLRDGNAKLVDLMAEITWTGWEPLDASVSFRLDWWAESYNSVNNPITLPHYFGAPIGSDPQVGYFTSEWVTIPLTGTGEKQWLTVNPFNQRYLPIQPRWISVEVKYVQPEGVVVWLDNVNFTGKCVPEPASLMALGLGVIGLGGMISRRRRK